MKRIISAEALAEIKNELDYQLTSAKSWGDKDNDVARVSKILCEARANVLEWVLSRIDPPRPIPSVPPSQPIYRRPKYWRWFANLIDPLAKDTVD